MSSKGRFLAFEGLDGSGKSTLIKGLERELKSQGLSYVISREPGGTELGEAIRHLLQHSKEGHSMTPETELLLFAASRAQLVREKIRPLLEAGVFVILDRFLDSTTVYQGHARGLPSESVQAINHFAIGGTRPHLTIVLDLETSVAWQRIHQSGRELDRMESQPPAFFEKVRQGYLDLAAIEPRRISVVDAARDPQQVHETVWTLVTERSQTHAV